MGINPLTRTEFLSEPKSINVEFFFLFKTHLNVFDFLEFGCRQEISVPKNETYLDKGFKQVTCPSGTGICTIPYTERKTRIVLKNVTQNVPIYKCRDGYKEGENNICAPICTNDCEHGSCVAPEQCKCFEGYENDKIEYEPNAPTHTHTKNMDTKKRDLIKILIE